MSIRQALFAVMFIGAAVSPAIASPADTFAGGEAGYVEPAPQFGAAVGDLTGKPLAARQGYRRGDPSTDGRYVYVGGDQDWALRLHEMRFQDGKLVHGDACAHDSPKPIVSMSDVEKRLFGETQIGG
jgi:hypothetical protein